MDNNNNKNQKPNSKYTLRFTRPLNVEQERRMVIEILESVLEIINSNRLEDDFPVEEPPKKKHKK